MKLSSDKSTSFFTLKPAEKRHSNELAAAIAAAEKRHEAALEAAEKRHRNELDTKLETILEKYGIKKESGIPDDKSEEGALKQILQTNARKPALQNSVCPIVQGERS